MGLTQRLRRSFIAGFFVTVPLVASVVAIVWMFRVVGAPVPGLGILATVLLVLAIGAVATNVIGRRLLQRGEQLLLHVPLFRTIYAPVKQLISAFAPDNEGGFKRVVLVEDGERGYVMGFLTREFTVDRGAGPESVLAVYVPTNHLYLGDIRVCPADRVLFPDLSVEDGLRVFLTGGMGLPGRLRARRDA
jgi:uncharacterized membrane protein